MRADQIGVTFGAPLIVFDTVASTQDEAKRLVQSGANAGTVVVARMMTAGRGRRGARWFTPRDASVCMSAIAPSVPPARLWQLAPLAAVAITDAIRAVAPEVDAQVRFPNDVLFGGRKLAGVLIETLAVGEDQAPIVGIGINVLARPFPDEIIDRAVALENVAAPPVDVLSVQTTLLDALTDRWRQWESEGIGPIVSAWNSRLDRSAEREFVIDGATIEARVDALAADGSVVLRLPDGATRTLPAALVGLADSL